MYVILKA